MRRVLTEPKNAIVKQYEKLFSMDNVKLVFTPGALDMIVDKAIEYKLGARGLRSIVETVMMDAMFDIPSQNVEEFVVSDSYVLQQLKKANFEVNKL